jgi:hypothetical protein
MRRMLRVFLVFVATLFLLGNSNCSKQVSTADSPLFVTSIAIEDANGIAASTFLQGATIQFVLSVRNRSTSSQTLWFNTGEISNFAVVQDGTGNAIWSSDHGQNFVAGFVSLTFLPGEVKTFSVSWNQADDNGNAVITGNYEVQGGLTVYNTVGAGGAADTGNSMAVGLPSGKQMTPTLYRSSLTFFTIH